MKRQLKGVWASIFFWASLAFAVFQLYTAGAGYLIGIRQRAIHIIFGLSLSLFMFSFRKRGGAETKVSPWDLFLITIVLVANINAFLLAMKIYLFPNISTPRDLILGAMLIVLVLELLRRVVGWIIPSMVVAGFVYIFVSPYLPGIWQFRGVSLKHVIENVYYSSNGIYGSIVGISSTLVAVFIIFGALLLATGAGETFVDLAQKIAGRYRGGPAKVAVVASAMFGTISGSAIANVAVTGNYTIPLMKKLGYRSEFAGAVESTASTGGMLTPPIMATAAFVMSELIEVPYLKIIIYAIIPAFLYYTCVFAGVHFEALRLKLSPVPKEEMRPWREILIWTKLGPFIIPIALLLILLVMGRDISAAGFYSCMALIVLFLFGDLRITLLKQRIIELGKALSKGGQALAELVPLLVGINILISLFALSGLIIKFSGMLVDIGQASLIVGLLVAGLVPIFLGMAIVAVAAYILGAAIVVPSLAGFGIAPLPAHMFVFYLTCLAPITPPVCPAVFVGASIAGAPWQKVAWVSVRLGAVAFVIPFFFVINPTLLGIGPLKDVLYNAFTASIGAVLLAAGFFGYLFFQVSLFVRLLFVTSGFVLLIPGAATDIIGVVLAAIGIAFDILMRRIKAAKLAKGQ